MRLLIVGGSDAGISAALRAREVDRNAEITVLLADDFPNYSICGLPFYLSGETPDWKALAHRTEFDGITICRSHKAAHIDVSGKTVSATDRDGKVVTHATRNSSSEQELSPVAPHIDGLDLAGVFPLHTMRESFVIHEFVESAKPRRAVIVGAGYIGLEMADALTHRGIEVTIASRTPSVLPAVEPTFGEAIARELEHHGVHVFTRVEAHAIVSTADHLHVSGNEGFEQDCEMVLVAVGVKPNTHLGVVAGLKTGVKGALLVNRQMETAIPEIYAAGDCVETWHRLLHRYTYLPLGTTAHKQGRCAGENAAGGDREFAGSMGTQVVKIFDLVIARTGLRQDEALNEGYAAYTTESISFDHKAYYPGAKQVRIRVTGDSQTGRLLGAQILGSWGTEISKRIDIFATALFSDMRVEELDDLDLSYTPPLSSPWDPVQTAGQHWAIALGSAKIGGAMHKVIFACVHNAGRSQMSAAFFNQLADPNRARAISAGTQPAERVHPVVVEAMLEVGIDLRNAKPQRLTAELAQGAEMLITMGCGDDCPYLPGLRRDDWPLPDPKDQGIDSVRNTREEIRERVLGLLARECLTRDATTAT